MSSGDDESTTEGESSQRSIAESTADGRKGRERRRERADGTGIAAHRVPRHSDFKPTLYVPEVSLVHDLRC